MGDYYRGSGYRGGWRGGGGRSGGRYNDQPYQGDRGYYNDGYQGGRGPPRGGYQGGYQGPPPPRGGGGGYHDGGRYSGRGPSQGPPDNYYEGGGGRGRGRGRGRYNWGRGGGGRSGPPPAQRRRDTLPDDIQQLTELKKHEKQVTCLHYDPHTQQLYSGSSDGSICAWSCSTGQLVSSDVVAPFGVDSIHVDSSFMFVGMSRDQEGIVKVYNLAAGGASHQLTGHRGQVYALAFANNTLFTAGQDTSIRVWGLNEQAGIFMSQAILDATNFPQDAHKSAVHSLLLVGQYLFSGDRSGTLKVWDLGQGACVQTVVRAHHSAITSMLIWGEFLLTSSMDGTIKVWSPGSSGAEIINPTPEFKYPEEDTNPGRSYRPQETVGVLSMCVTADHAQKSVLMLATAARDASVKLLELPQFSERGVLPDVNDCRALAAIPEHHIMLTGERSGTIRIFQWKG